MAASYNRVQLIGHLGRDPEQRNFQNGGQVVNLRLATTKRFQRDGEWQEVTQWHQVCIFSDHHGTIAMEHLRKGSCVMIEGELTYRGWKDQQGNDRVTTEVVVPKFGGGLMLMDKRSESGAGSARAAAPRQESGTRRAAPAAAAMSSWDDDIPF